MKTYKKFMSELVKAKKIDVKELGVSTTVYAMTLTHAKRLINDLDKQIVRVNGNEYKNDDYFGYDHLDDEHDDGGLTGKNGYSFTFFDPFENELVYDIDPERTLKYLKTLKPGEDVSKALIKIGAKVGKGKQLSLFKTKKKK